MKKICLIYSFLLYSLSMFSQTYSGTCGDPNVNGGKNVKWTLSNGTLTISGSGAMLDYKGGATSSSEMFGWMGYYSSIKSVIVKSGVTTVGTSAFVSCSNLSSVTLASSVIKIGDDAFNGCSSLKNVVLPNALTSIGARSFQRTNIKSITFPSTIQSIGTYAFMNSYLDTVICQANTPPTLGSSPFGYSKGDILYVYNVDTYQNAGWSSYFSEIREIGATYYKVSLSCDDSQGFVSGDGTYKKGTSATISATPRWDNEYEYAFKRWSDGNTSNPRTLTVTKDISLTAEFTKYRKYTVSLNCDYSQGYVSGYGTYKEGESVTISATPSYGYKFVRWSDGNTSNPRTLTVTKDISLTAEFAKVIKYTVSLNCNQSQGYVSGGGTYEEGTSITISATPYSGCKFVRWNDGNTSNPRTLTVTKDISLTAEFAKNTANKYTITLNCDLSQGTVSGGGTYEKGTSITISATPYSGCKFVRWSDGNTSNPRTLTVTENLTLTAEFAKNTANKYTITLNCDQAQGTVSGSGTYEEGMSVTITAIPNKGYHFTQWSDGNTSNPRIIEVVGNKTYIAYFNKTKLAEGVIKETYSYPSRGNGKYTLENNWVISQNQNNFATKKPGSNGYVRGMAVKDGIMYFINRETMSLTRVDAHSGAMLEPLMLQGTDTLFKMQQEDGTWAYAVTFPYNDIKFDQAGNCLIGACVTGLSKCQTFYIYIVDLATGKCTKLIEDVLWENPGLDQVQFRFDAFGVAGDVTKNGVIMAANALGKWDAYHWSIKNGKARKGRQIAVHIDPTTDQSLFINANDWGYNPQIVPQDEAGCLFYVDGSNTLPMLFGGTPESGAELIDDFINVPTGRSVWNDEENVISLETRDNGIVEFQVGENYFLLMATLSPFPGSRTNSSLFALYKFADYNRTFEGMEPLWYFPHNALGSKSNQYHTAIPSVTVLDDKTAFLYIYKPENGYASYTLTINDSFETATEEIRLLQITNTQKIFRNGQLIILRDGVEYNAQGQELR